MFFDFWTICITGVADAVDAVDIVGKEWLLLSPYAGWSENNSSEWVDIEGGDDVECEDVGTSDLRMALKGKVMCTI